MKKLCIILGITLVLIITALIGCIEEEKGSVAIKGKGTFNSIQDAIDNAYNGDKILVYQGIYNETITINKSISLIAVDKNSTILQYFGNETDIAILKINESNCTIDGFIISGCIELSQSNGIKIESNNNIIINNTIQDFVNGLYLDNSDNIMASNNKILNNDNGLYMTRSIDNKILSNNITKNSIYGVFTLSQSNNNSFKYNQISQNNIGLRIKGSQKNKFENNFVKNNQRKGFYFCCGAINNAIFNNSIINNNLNADDHYNNNWHFNDVGNYWDDYEKKYPEAIDENNDGFWDIPYLVYQDTKDLFPLVQYIEK